VHYRLQKLNSSKITGLRERIDADEILSIPLNLIRNSGIEGVTEFLLPITHARFIVVNAETYDDLDTVTAAVRNAVAQGKRFFYHTSSSFVRSFMQQSAKLIDFPSVETGPGLIVVGSYVQKTQRQLSKLLEIEAVEGIPLTVDEIVAHPQGLRQRILREINEVLSNGKTAVLYLEKNSKASEISRGDVMDTGLKITAFFCSCVNKLQVKPSFILGKGGITSHELLKHGLKVAFARVAGQAVPGVPVIQMNPAHRFSGMYYAIFPGNVGSDETLAEVVLRLINNERLHSS